MCTFEIRSLWRTSVSPPTHLPSTHRYPPTHNTPTHPPPSLSSKGLIDGLWRQCGWEMECEDSMDGRKSGNTLKSYPPKVWGLRQLPWGMSETRSRAVALCPKIAIPNHFASFYFYLFYFIFLSSLFFNCFYFLWF